MILSFLSSCALLAAVELAGVTGASLGATAYFNSNNVRVGEPMELRVVFLGETDFADIHPPALSREVDAKIWKIDDAGAKTESSRERGTGELVSRALVYRVRPLKEGLHYFPALDFVYRSADSNEYHAATLAMPVRVKPGSQAVLAGLEEVDETMPVPDGLVFDTGDAPLTDDERFAWRRACAKPSAAAFREFDFPAARLNEAAMATLEGNWARALEIYSRLEWRTGQTPAIEHGIVAALALKNANPGAELPAWRVIGRPILVHAWAGRVGIVAGIALALALVFALLSRAVRALAALAFVALLALPGTATAFGSDPFAEMERMMQAHRAQMEEMQKMMMGGFSSSMTINGEEVAKPDVKATLTISTGEPRIGEKFEFLFALEVPKGTNAEIMRMEPTDSFGFQQDGKVRSLPEEVSPRDPEKVVRKIAIPVRYDVPYRGRVGFNALVRVRSSGKRTAGGGGFSSFSFSQDTSVAAEPVEVSVADPAMPPDYSGAIGADFRLVRRIDRRKVETNDVVTVRSELSFTGMPPAAALPGEISRSKGHIFLRDYFVADGRGEIPEEKLVYYDVVSNRYDTLVAKAQPLVYVAEADEPADAAEVAVDLKASGDDGSAAGKTITLLFEPREGSRAVAAVPLAPGEKPVELERYRAWRRVVIGGRSGWVRGA